MTENNGLYELPESWKWTTIGEEFSVKGGKRLPKGNSYATENTGLYYIRVKDFDNLSINTTDLRCISPETQEQIRRYTISKKDVFISIAGSIGKVGVIPEFLDGANLTENAAKITDIQNYNNKLLALFLSSQFAQSQISQLVTSSNQPKLALFRIEKIVLPLIPLPEQERIVAKIEELFTQLEAGVAELQQAKTQLQRYRQAVLKSAVEGELTREWRAEARQVGARRAVPQHETGEELLARILSERRAKWEAEGGKGKYKEPTPLDTDGLSGLPDGWVWTSLDQLLWKIEAGKSFKAEGRPANADEYGVIKVSAMSWGNFLPNENKTLYPNADISKSSSVKAGDLLISRANTVELVGAVVLVERDYPNLLLSDKSLRLIPTSEETDKRCILYSLRSQWVRNVYERLATGTSDSMRNLSQPKIRSAPIALPSLDEQKRIADKVERRLSVADEIEKKLDQALARSERLRQSILKRAFEGRLV